MIDLHIHSNYSDGTLSPTEIANEALRCGISTFSITDHDSIFALEEVTEYVKDKEISFIPGVEMSTAFNGIDLHILAYFVDFKNIKIIETVNKLRENRVTRAARIVQLLQDNNFNVTDEDVYKFSDGGAVGRVHIAKALLNKKYVKSISEAFDLYLGKNSPYYIAKEVLSTADAISLLKEAGAIVILAHPGLDNIIDQIDKIMDMNFDGIEVYHPQNSIQQRKFLRNYANRHRYLITGGSDNHGNNGSHSCPIGGIEMPANIIENLISHKQTITGKQHLA